jgi:SNF2 family DNA or RNA helicase
MHFYADNDEVKSKELTLVSYQTATTMVDDICSYLRRDGNRVMVVLDEAHRIKNTEGGVWAEAVLALAKYAKSRVVLTGTPAPNGYQDIYNQFKFIWPNRNVLGFSVANLADMSSSPYDTRREALINNAAPFFVRITKKDLRIPDPTENPPIIVPLGNIQRTIYEYLDNTYLEPFVTGLSDSNPANQLVRAKLIRLMQAASNPGLLAAPLDEIYQDIGFSTELFLDDQQVLTLISKYEELETPPKFEALSELISKQLQIGERVIVWAYFVKNILGIQQHLEEKGIQSEVLWGGTPSAFNDQDEGFEGAITREKIIRDFHSPNCAYRVLVANPFAVGESISLHKACHVAIYFERNFAAGTFLQSKDRIHRYGLPAGQETNYYYLISENSVDETIHQRLDEKIERMLQIIESREIPLINMNTNYTEDLENDFKAVIRDYLRRTPRD